MTKQEAIDLAIKICEAKGRTVEISQNQNADLVTPVDDEGDQIWELQMQIIKADDGDGFILVEPTGGGRGDVQTFIHTDQGTFRIF